MMTFVILLSFVGCSFSPQLSNNTKILKKENIIFTASEYKKLSRKDDGELSIDDNDLVLLEKPFIKDKEYAIKPVKLSKNIHSIVDILNDSHFTKEYYVGNLTKFVYKRNKALAIFISDNLHGDDKESGSGYCVGGSQYLFYLKDNEVQVKVLGSFSGDIAPVVELVK